MESPEELVKLFITDYKKWNDQAYELDQSDTLLKIENAELTYNEFISQYCSPELVPQGAAFGSDSNHSLEEEEIISVETKADSALICTKHVDSTGFASDYEYHLQLVNGVWKLTSLMYVDSEGKYESL